jgi:glucose/arabinose dehydrogenase
MPKRWKLISGLFIPLTFAPLAVSASGPIEVAQLNPAFKIEQLASGLGIPWGMAFLNDNEIIFTEREGQVKILDLRDLKLTTLTGLPKIAVNGQGGMLDVAPRPDTNQSWIYFTYSKASPSGPVTTLARAQREQNRLHNWQDLLVTNAASSTSRHFGSRIAFDNQGHVFFGVGDRGVRDNAQNLANHAGSIIRLNLDGSIPDDNPFVQVVGAMPEIWSYGHRNPQGLQYDLERNILWANEHGPRGGDEINRVEKGRNYGWPAISYGKEYLLPLWVGDGFEKEGMEQPVKVFTPSIAPGSLLLYSADVFPEWRGSLFSGALKLQHLNRVFISKNNQAQGEERLLSDLNQRIRALALGPEGYVYLSTDSGTILRMRPPE